MNVSLLFNPKSGTGKRQALLDEISSQLRQDGHKVLPLRVGGEEMEESAARQTLAASGALLICGGDGTLNRTLPLALSTGVPVYHVPLGTENLFARHFDMSSDPARIREALARGMIESVDTATCNGVPFAIMCSAGPDADVIHRLSATRTGGISHLHYVKPIVAEALGGSVAPISLEVDGNVLVENRKGMVVVANGEHYGFRANPCIDASMHDGVLDVAFFPSPFPLAAGAWLLASRLGAAAILPGRLKARGTHVVVVSESASFRVQMDGEAMQGPDGSDRQDVIEIRIAPRSLRVLCGNS